MPPDASLVLGIDPGASGAVALLTMAGELVDVRDLPTLPAGPKQRAEINVPVLADMVREWKPIACFVELVGPRPTDGAKAAFSFGATRASIEATMAVLGVRVMRIAPQTWKRMFNIPPGDGQKGTARVEATRRWPAHGKLFARVKDSDRAEAALIGVCGLRKDAGQ